MASTYITPEQAGFTQEVGYQLLLQNAIIKIMKEINDVSRDAVAGVQPETKVKITDGTTSYGTIGRNKTSIKAEVADSAVVVAEHADATIKDVNPDKMGDIIDLINQHGTPDMLIDVLDVDKVDSLKDQAVSHYMETGETLPGFAINERQGNLTIRPSSALTAVAHEWAVGAGLIAG